MNEYEIAGLAASRMAAWASVASASAAAFAAVGIWFFGVVMFLQNRSRAKQAAEDRKEAAEDRKVTQGMLAALQELIRRTSPPRPGPAE